MKKGIIIVVIMLLIVLSGFLIWKNVNLTNELKNRDQQTLNEENKEVVSMKDNKDYVHDENEVKAGLKNANVVKIEIDPNLPVLKRIEKKNFFNVSYENEGGFDLQESKDGIYCNFEDGYYPGCSIFCGVNYISFSVTASSMLPKQGIYSYFPNNLIDGLRETAWVEGVTGDGIGEYLEFYFGWGHCSNKVGDTEHFSKMCITNGYAATEKNYYENNRVKTLLMYIDDVKTAYIHLEDELITQVYDLSNYTYKNGINSKIKFEIIEVYKGTKYEDTCITDIDIYGLAMGH